MTPGQQVTHSATNKQNSDSAAAYRRDTRRTIFLPILAGALVIIAGIVAVLLLPRPPQKSLIADLMLAIFFLCPTVLCLIPLYLVIVTMAFGFGRAHNGLTGPLRRLGERSQAIAARTLDTAEAVNRKTTTYRARFAPIEKQLHRFDDLESARSSVEEDEHDPDNPA